MTNKRLYEDILKIKGTSSRPASKALKQSQANSIGPFDIMGAYFKLHKAAKKAAAAEIKDDIKVKDLESIEFSNSCIDRTANTFRAAKQMTIGIYLGLGEEKGMFTKRLSSLFKGKNGNAGVQALKAYVTTFCGEEFAKQVTQDTVYNGFNESNNKVIYYVTIDLNIK